MGEKAKKFFTSSIIIIYISFSIKNLKLIGPNNNEEFFYPKAEITCLKNSKSLIPKIRYGPVEISSTPPLVKINNFPLMIWPHNFGIDRIPQNIMIKMGEIFGDPLLFSRLSGLIFIILSAFLLRKISGMFSPQTFSLALLIYLSFSAVFFVPLYQPSYSLYPCLYIISIYFFLKYEETKNERYFNLMLITTAITTFSYLIIGLGLFLPLIIMKIKDKKRLKKLMIGLILAITPYIIHIIISLPLLYLIEKEETEGGLCIGILTNAFETIKRILEFESELGYTKIITAKIYLLILHVINLIDFRDYGEEPFFKFEEHDTVNYASLIIISPIFLIPFLKGRKTILDKLWKFLIAYAIGQILVYGHMRKMIYIIPIFSLLIAEILRLSAEKRKLIPLVAIIIALHTFSQVSRTYKIMEQIKDKGRFSYFINSEEQIKLSKFIENSKTDKDIVNLLSPINLEIISAGKVKINYLTLLPYFYLYYLKDKDFPEHLKKYLSGKVVIIPKELKEVIEIRGEKIYESAIFEMFKVY